MINDNKAFEHFDSDDFKAYQNRLLIQVLEVILAEKGELTPEDLKNAYEQCRVLIQQDIEFLAKKWCLLRNSGELKVDPSKCYLSQIDDAVDLKRDAVELVHKLSPDVLFLLYDQPEDKRLQILAHFRTIFKMRLQITSGAVSTFPGLFPVLLEEMNAIDELMDGEDLKLKPALESLLSEVGPRIVLKIKKYYDHPRLGYEECKFCNSHWVEKPTEPDIKNLNTLSCFKTPRELEKFLALRFRRTFYGELLDFITAMEHFLAEGGFEN